MTRHPATGMSKRQRAAFERIAINDDRRVHPATALALKLKGLIEFRTEIVGRDCFGLIEITRYEVPLPIHMKWCQWCSENVKDDEP